MYFPVLFWEKFMKKKLKLTDHSKTSQSSNNKISATNCFLSIPDFCSLSIADFSSGPICNTLLSIHQQIIWTSLVNLGVQNNIWRADRVTESRQFTESLTKLTLTRSYKLIIVLGFEGLLFGGLTGLQFFAGLFNEGAIFSKSALFRRVLWFKFLSWLLRFPDSFCSSRNSINFPGFSQSIAFGSLRFLGFLNFKLNCLLWRW